MRYGIDTLAAIIEAKYHLPIFVPNTLFLFCGRRANKIKGLVWEGDGFLLFTKRVEAGHFSWPRTSEEARLLSAKQFEWLMQGFSIDPVIKESHPDKTA
jgi:transposase